ncbi:MAG: multi-sensor signal transduction histidine kinase [Deltaproteobacteria bacterium]|jgi:signal transduction histidine kinase|nr:multi-sensor signal transduction histidine kinase [Deltaproteobacteria bacterium]
MSYTPGSVGAGSLLKPFLSHIPGLCSRWPGQRTEPRGCSSPSPCADPNIHVRLEVEDTGIGISGEDRLRLFTEFFRTKNARAFTQEGTGLGLVIVKEILDFINGKIQVESEVGKGTRFIVRLPCI